MKNLQKFDFRLILEEFEDKANQKKNERKKNLPLHRHRMR